MRNEPWTETDLERALALRGAELQHWPEAERAAAEALLKKAPDLNRLIAQEKRAVEMLAALPVLQPSALLRARILEIPVMHERTRGALGWTWTRWLSFGMAAGVLVFGMGGLSGWIATDDATTVEDRAGLTADESPPDSDDEWDELAEMALTTDLTEEWP